MGGRLSLTNVLGVWLIGIGCLLGCGLLWLVKDAMTAEVIEPAGDLIALLLMGTGATLGFGLYLASRPGDDLPMEYWPRDLKGPPVRRRRRHHHHHDQPHRHRHRHDPHHHPGAAPGARRRHGLILAFVARAVDPGMTSALAGFGLKESRGWRE